MIVGTVHLVDGAELRISEHAGERYRTRVCPELDDVDALEHLRRLASLAGARCQRPAWAHEHGGRHRCDRLWWVTLGPDVFLLVETRLAVTVIVRTPADRMAAALRAGIADNLLKAAA